MAKKIDITHKKSSVAAKIPLPGNLVAGELALNTADGKAFTKKDDGTVVEIGGGSTERGGLLYDATKSYKKGDIVYDEITNHLYAGLTDNPAGWVVAGSGWIPMTAGEMNYNRPYKKGDVASRYNVLYIAKIDTVGVWAPNANNWIPVTSPAERGGIAWDPSTTYVIDDVVIYNGKMYRNLSGRKWGSFEQPDWAEVGASTAFVPTEPSRVAGSSAIGNMISISRIDYDALTVPRDPNTVFVIK